MELPSKKSSSLVGSPPVNYNTKLVLPVISVVCFLLSAVLWWMTAVSTWNTDSIYVTDFQTIQQVKKDVTKCEENKTEGFTCIVIPLMVSEEFAKDTTP